MRFREFVANIQTKKLKLEIRPIINALLQLVDISIQQQELVQTEGRLHKAHDITIQFWTDLQSPVYNWLEKHSINWSRGKLPRYKDGGAGRVYFLGEQVVKFTTDPVEAVVAHLARGLEVVAVIDVLRLSGDSIFAILQEFINMDDTPDEIREAADYLMVIIDENEIDRFPSDEDAQKKLVLPILKEYNKTNLLPYVMLVMKAHIKLYKRTGFFHDDAVGINIALHKGNVVFPDLGANQTQHYNPNNTLDKIKRNLKLLGRYP